MGCLINLFKIFLLLIFFPIMFFAGYKLIFEPYYPGRWSQKDAEEFFPQDTSVSMDKISYDIPMQTGPTHDYIMDNTFQKPFVRMELDPELEKGLVYVIKAFKAVFGQDFSPTIISAHDSFDRHEKWSPHCWGHAVDIALADLPLKDKRRLVKFLKATLPDDYTIKWEYQGTKSEQLHFQYLM